MSDLAERLRICADDDLREYARDSLIGLTPDQGEFRQWASFMEEAAAEIERLTAERDRAMAEANDADARVVAIAIELAEARRGLQIAQAACPFNDDGATDLVPDDHGETDPCPVCGDIGTQGNGGRPRRCPSQSTPAGIPIVKAGERE